LSEKEIVRANKLGVDVIVTDHHNVAPVQPPAVAVINPKRLLQDHPDEYEAYILKPSSRLRGKVYPFLDLPGVGVAFKLVQALQTRLEGMPTGQEKWLLDLVALGTVCDVVTLVNENRTHVFWGLKVLAQTRRPGLKALMAVAGVEQAAINARHLGFGLGPRMNAAGRLETAQYSLTMLRASDPEKALESAQLLDDMNKARRSEQDAILEEAVVQAEQYSKDAVLVVSAPGWNHGIIGIVAAKLLEKYQKPTYVLEEMGDEAKGSARSYGDFSAADAIRAADDIITKGGGHKLAAGVTMPTKNIAAFRKRVNEFYAEQKLFNQQALLLPQADVTAAFGDVTEDFIAEVATLEPFGNGNPQPIIRSEHVLVMNQRRMGSDGQHVKLELKDTDGKILSVLAFGAPPHFFAEPGETVTVWYHPDINEWNGRRSVEGRLLHLESE
jgi:single-stranded-DNA-specific exonuclease